MKVLALDQATKTGYSVFDGNNLITYGLGDFTEYKDDPFIRNNKIKHFVSNLIKVHLPMLVVIEDVQLQNNPKVYKDLSTLQGCLCDFFVENKTLFQIVEPTKWKSFIFYKKIT